MPSSQKRTVQNFRIKTTLNHNRKKELQRGLQVMARDESVRRELQIIPKKWCGDGRP